MLNQNLWRITHLCNIVGVTPCFWTDGRWKKQTVKLLLFPRCSLDLVTFFLFPPLLMSPHCVFIYFLFIYLFSYKFLQTWLNCFCMCSSGEPMPSKSWRQPSTQSRRLWMRTSSSFAAPRSQNVCLPFTELRRRCEADCLIFGLSRACNSPGFFFFFFCANLI